ncbi:Uncharacterised protein [Shigella sonnei]|nr:Uncharacterised protein [Shigella sonnei]
MPVIFKRLILTTCRGREIIHRLFNMVIDCVVPGVGGFARLEISVRIGGRTTDHRMFRVERPGAMSINFGLRHEIKNRVIGQRDNFVDFVGRAETIKEMNKWHAAFQRRDVRNESKVLRFLDVCRTQHRATRLAHRHDVGMIAKNRECMCGNGTCRYMQDKRCESPCQFVQCRDHQQQTLR